MHKLCRFTLHNWKHEQAGFTLIVKTRNR